MSEVLDQLIERIWPTRQVRVESLPGGITNANFLVDLGDEKVVVRIPGRDTALLGIDRQHEVAAHRLASSTGIAPEVLFESATDEWLITRFLPARVVPPEELAREPLLGEVAATLRRIHRAGSVDAVFNPHSTVRRYHDTAASRRVVEPFDYEFVLSVLDRIAAVRPFVPTSFCHNDLLNANILYDDHLRVLDWEYAAMGDPFFDLANFSVNHGLPSCADEGLLRHYFGYCDTDMLAALELTKLVSEVREAMWGVVQQAVSTLDVDFATYATERGDHFTALLDSMDFEELTRRAQRVPSPLSNSAKS